MKELNHFEFRLKKIILTLVSVALCAGVLAKLPPNSLKLMSMSLEKDPVSEDEIAKDELLSKFTKYDYSHIWMEQNDALLGFIGEEQRQRFYMRFLSVIKDPDDPTTYFVYGKSRVKSNICIFQGTIKLLHVRQNTYIGQNVDEKDDSVGAYLLIAEYHFAENPSQKGTGKFEGILVSYFSITDGKARYGDWWEDADGYRNNQCAGIWTSYVSGVSKVCNWGEYRIPFSAGFDLGAGEFSPAEKYSPYGWDSYIKAINGDTAAQAEEIRQWWK